jgi:hypothetical protein
MEIYSLAGEEEDGEALQATNPDPWDDPFQPFDPEDPNGPD